MKNEQLDHVVSDLRRHSTVRYTGTGPGDNAHIRVAKIPFRSSNKTKDEEALYRQMIKWGKAPRFLISPLVSSQDDDKSQMVGNGAQTTLNSFVVDHIRRLSLLNCSTEICNQPNLVVQVRFQCGGCCCGCFFLPFLLLVLFFTTKLIRKCGRISIS
jgi:hypothetical protein